MTPALWVAAAAGILLLGLLLIRIGRSRGRSEAAAEAVLAEGQARAKSVRELAAEGDDAGVQRKLAEAAERAAKTTGRN